MASTPATSIKPRRSSQAERGAATRAKLIHATIATLNTLGYTATTTIEVVRRATVSRGAMLHHFCTRAELLLATAEHVLREQEIEWRDSLRTVERGEARFHAITDVMWNSMHQPEAVALTEIMLGARSDPEMHLRFSRLMKSFNHRVMDGPKEVADDVGFGDRRLLRAMARLHGAAMRGLVIDELYWDESDPSIEDAFDLLVWYKGLLMRRLSDPAFVGESRVWDRPLRRQPTR